jgi:hypothetical protein
MRERRSIALGRAKDLLRATKLENQRLPEIVRGTFQWKDSDLRDLREEWR